MIHLTMIKDITYCFLLLYLVLIKIFPQLYLEVSTGKISFLFGRNIENLETKTKQEIDRRMVGQQELKSIFNYRLSRC